MGGSHSSPKPEDDPRISANLSNNNSNEEPSTADNENDSQNANTNANACAALAIAPPVINEAPLRRSASQEFLDETIADNSVVIFSKTTCGFCDQAKSVFDQLGVGYKTVELDSRPDCGELQDNLRRMTGARTVPRVFVDGQCIGGGSDTLSMFRKGALQQLLKTKNIECPKCDEIRGVE